MFSIEKKNRNVRNVSTDRNFAIILLKATRNIETHNIKKSEYDSLMKLYIPIEDTKNYQLRKHL